MAPHVNDTLLLAARVGMAVVGGFNPLTTPWLATKLVLLLAYIGLGTLALKRGKTPQQRAIAFVLALAALAAIVHVALSKAGLVGLNRACLPLAGKSRLPGDGRCFASLTMLSATARQGRAMTPGGLLSGAQFSYNNGPALITASVRLCTLSLRRIDDMRLDRAFGDIQLDSDKFIGLAADQIFQNAAFLLGQRGDARGHVGRARVVGGRRAGVAVAGGGKENIAVQHGVDRRGHVGA